MRSFVGLAVSMCACIAIAQGQQSMAEKLAALQYPELASRTRIQGDVRIVIDAGEPRVLSGNQLLTAGTVENARIISVASESVELVFHYQLAGGTRLIHRNQPKGNAFDRMILRLLHRPTFRVVPACEETRDTIPPNRADFTKKPIEVWVYGGDRCLQT
jgi:hypothetical protein